jgi:CRISPR-associated protein Cmr3
LEPPADAQTDFDEDERKRKLRFVGLKSSDFPEDKSRKPLAHGLRYWYWHHFQNWLIDPTRLTQLESVDLSSLGYGDLVRERRFHVSMDSDREMGKDGLLFGTSGLEFTHPGLGAERLQGAKRLALAVDVEDEKMVPQEGVAGLGGERRLVAWRRSNGHLPTCHDEIKKAIMRDRHCRLILLTPAYFEQGYLPDWLCTTYAKEYGVTVELQAIAVRRPQVVSGWDLAISMPKPSRRLAPAGTVLFLSVQGDDTAVSNWIENTWMQCISDDGQARRDGFGLAVLGTWSGQPVAM